MARTHTQMSLLSVVFCALTGKQQGAQTSDFSPLTLRLMGGNVSMETALQFL